MRPQAIVRALTLRSSADLPQPVGIGKRVRCESGGLQNSRLFRGKIGNRVSVPGVILFSDSEKIALFY